MVKAQKLILIGIYTILLSTFSWSQNKNICGEVHYKQVKEITSTSQQNFLMKFDNKQSLSEEINIKLSENDISEDLSEKGMTKTVIIGRKNTTPAFFYNDRNNFYFSDIWPDDILVVKEDPFNWNWKLHQDTKKIGDFTCQKATIRFRGRNYIAWFTNQIPVPFGPWKFKGLSGLILEVYDTDKVFHITTSEIKIDKEVNCSINVDENQLKKAMTIDRYLTRKEELINAQFAKLASRMPKGFEVPKWDKDCEDCPKGLEIFNEEN